MLSNKMNEIAHQNYWSEIVVKESIVKLRAIQAAEKSPALRDRITTALVACILAKSGVRSFHQEQDAAVLLATKGF